MLARSSLRTQLATGLLLVAAGASLCAQAQAGSTGTATQPVSESIWARDKLTGDWGGLRTDLTKHGIDIELRNSHFYQEVTSGGVHSNGEYGIKLDTFINIDASKLFGSWDGLTISTHIESRDGNDVLADAGAFTLPNTSLLYPEPGNYDGTNVTSFMVTQMLFDDKAALLAGKMGSMDLLQGLFPDIVDYGLDGFMSANSYMSILSWGRWLTLSQYGVAGWMIADGLPSTGFIVAGHDNVTTTWDTSDSFDDGVGILLFHRFTFELGGLPGYVYFDIGGSTKQYNSLDPVDWTNIPGEGPVDDDEKRPWDTATYWYQEFWQHEDDKDRRAHAFVGFTVGDDNPSFSDWDAFVTFQAFGPFDARPHDRMGIAYHYYHLADDFVALVSALPSENLRDNSWSSEVFYNVQITPWLHLTPNFQYAQNENKSDDPAIIAGVRLVIDL